MLPSAWTVLALSPFAGAAVIQRASSSYAFSIYQSSDCSGASEDSPSGSAGSFPMCSPPMGSIGSVLVTANAGGQCAISFYTAAKASQCDSGIADQPAYQLGQCYQFDASNPPTSYGINCGD